MMKKLVFLLYSLLLCMAGVLTGWAQDAPALKFKTEQSIGTKQSISVVTTEGAYRVDWGDGKSIEYSAMMSSGTVQGNYIAVYGSIKSLSLTGAKITEVETFNAPNLTIFNLSDNQLTSLVLPQLALLKSLSLQNNRLSELVLNNYPALETLNIKGNGIGKLTLNNLPQLKTLMMAENLVTELDLSKFTALSSVRASKNKLTKVVLAPNLKELHAEDNLLTSMAPVKDMPNLKTLRLSGNRIASMTVDGCAVFAELELNDNGLTALSLNNLPKLSLLYLKNNKLSAQTLETMYKALPNNNRGVIKIEGNEAAASSPMSIATDKGWKVDVAPVVQRQLVEGTDYTLSNDREGLARWLAEDLSLIDLNLDATLSQIKRIDDYAFFGAVSVHKILLPSSLQSVGVGSFMGCGLKEIKLPKGLKSIGKVNGKNSNPFGESLSLTKIDVEEGNSRFASIDGVLYSKDGSMMIAYPAGRSGAEFSIPKEVQEVGQWAFSGALFLKKVICPSELKTIHQYAFADAGLLNQVELNEGLTAIDWAAFQRTAIESISLPKSLGVVMDGAYPVNPFMGCTSLKEIRVAEGNSTYSVSEGILYASEKTSLIAVPASLSLEQYTLPASVKSIAMGAFAGQKSLKGVRIRQYIAVPLRAFDECLRLESVRLETGTPYIADQAFSGCTALKNIYLVNKKVPVIGEEAFDQVPATAVVYVAEGGKALYETDANWKKAISASYQEVAPIYSFLQIHREEFVKLTNTEEGAEFYNQIPEIAPLCRNNTEVVGNITGMTSIVVLGTQKGNNYEALYLVEVIPAQTSFVEPYQSRQNRNRANIVLYEKEQAQRILTQEEDSFGGKLVTFSSEQQPGVAVKYLFMEDEAVMYTTIVFDSKKIYTNLKADVFFAERYTAATGTDLDDQAFDGFVRPDGVGYEYREMDVEESNDPVINIAYFFAKEVTYKPITLHTETVEAQPIGSSLILQGNRLLFPQGSVEVAIYNMTGARVYTAPVQGVSSMELPLLEQGSFLVVVRSADGAGSVLKVMR